MGNTDPADPGHISLKKVEAGNLGAEASSHMGRPATYHACGLRGRGENRHGL